MMDPAELEARKKEDPTALAFSNLNTGAACALCSWGIDAAPLEVYEAKIVAHLWAAHGRAVLVRQNRDGSNLRRLP